MLVLIPPVMRTLPFPIKVAACSERTVSIFPVGTKLPLVGSNNSAEDKVMLPLNTASNKDGPVSQSCRCMEFTL